ncbi:MAG: SHOCT domain-containing protein [Candidatus Hydrothermarchaeales archaeon]
MKKEHIVFGALAALFLVFSAYEFLFFDPSMEHHRAMHSTMTGMTGPNLLGFNVLFWVLIFGFAYLLLRERPGEDNGNGALIILKERYANGEITRDEYLEIFRDLKER